jgi:hypothetical protein
MKLHEKQGTGHKAKSEIIKVNFQSSPPGRREEWIDSR